MIDASVIVSYIDSEDTLPILLSQLKNQDYPGDFEVILVNGRDFNPTASEARGQQIGIERSTGRVIFFTNSDRFPQTDWISSHMKFYPKYDLVAGNVQGHRTDDLQAMNFGNISMKRKVLEEIPINDIPSQQDCDFAFRFIRSKFRGTLGGSDVYEPSSAKWSAAHHFLMARNIMVLRNNYGLLPPRIKDILRIRHPAALVGGICGYIEALAGKREVVNAHHV